MRATFFRYLIAATVLMSVLPFAVCSAHYCMGGHMRHGPYHWIDYASHWAYLYLMIAIFPLALLGDLPERRLLYVLAFLGWAALFIIPAPHTALGFLGAGICMLTHAYFSPKRKQRELETVKNPTESRNDEVSE